MKYDNSHLSWSGPFAYRGHAIQTASDVHNSGSFTGQWVGSFRVTKDMTVIRMSTEASYHQSAVHAQSDAMRAAKVFIDQLDR